METFKLNGVVASHAQDNNYDVLSMSDDEMDMGADMGMGAGAGAGTEAGIDLDLEQQHKAADFGFDDILGSEIDDILNQVEEGETTQGDLKPNEGTMPQAIATIRSFLNTAASKFDTAVKTLETYMQSGNEGLEFSCHLDAPSQPSPRGGGTSPPSLRANRRRVWQSPT